MSSVTRRVLSRHFHGLHLSHLLPAYFEKCLHPPALIHSNSVPSGNMVTVARRQVSRVPPLS